MKIAAFVPDLMDRSKVQAVAPDAQFVSLAELSTVEADVVLIDLSRPGVLDALPTGVRWIGFASHVALPQVEGGTVLPRSKFFASLPALLARG